MTFNLTILVYVLFTAFNLSRALERLKPFTLKVE